MGFTKKISVDGSAALKNLGTLMRAAGYAGGGIVSSLAIFNPSATVPVYVHLSNNGSTAPLLATGATDGWPVSAGAATAATGNTFFSDRGGNMSSLDIDTTWLYTASSIDIIVMATGA